MLKALLKKQSKVAAPVETDLDDNYTICGPAIYKNKTGTKVYKGVIRSTGQRVIIKEYCYEKWVETYAYKGEHWFFKRDTFALWKSALDKEFELQSRVSSPHIVKALDAFLKDEKYYLITEYFSGSMTLEAYVHLKQRELRGCSQRKKEKFGKEFTRQILSALVTLHDEGIVHGDLKPENMIVCPDLPDPECNKTLFDPVGERSSLNSIKSKKWTAPMLKLIDFGNAFTFTHHMSDFIDRKTGTRGFLSPEMVNFVPKFYPPVIDVWQMGVISYFLIRGKTIYTSYKSYHGVDRSGSHFIQEYVRYRKQIQEHSDEAKIFIDLALQDSTKKRPSAYALACSKWINGDYKDRTPLEKQKYKFYMNQCLPKHAEATCIYVPLV